MDEPPSLVESSNKLCIRAAGRRFIKLILYKYFCSVFEILLDWDDLVESFIKTWFLCFRNGLFYGWF